MAILKKTYYNYIQRKIRGHVQFHKKYIYIGGIFLIESSIMKIL